MAILTAEVKDTVTTIVRDTLNLPADGITLTTNLRELPGVESIKILRIIAKIEKQYDIQLDDAIVFRLQTLGDLASAVSDLLGSSQSQGGEEPKSVSGRTRLGAR